MQKAGPRRDIVAGLPDVAGLQRGAEVERYVEQPTGRPADAPIVLYLGECGMGPADRITFETGQAVKLPLDGDPELKAVGIHRRRVFRTESERIPSPGMKRLDIHIHRVESLVRAEIGK